VQSLIENRDKRERKQRENKEKIGRKITENSKKRDRAHRGSGA